MNSTPDILTQVLAVQSQAIHLIMEVMKPTGTIDIRNQTLQCSQLNLR
jgi:hypothetical protein